VQSRYYNTMSAEGANLGQAKPDETLRQKDPVPDKLWKTPRGINPAWDTDGVTPAGRDAPHVIFELL
jgi:hypothetical protein